VPIAEITTGAIASFSTPKSSIIFVFQRLNKFEFVHSVNTPEI